MQNALKHAILLSDGHAHSLHKDLIVYRCSLVLLNIGGVMECMMDIGFHTDWEYDSHGKLGGLIVGTDWWWCITLIKLKIPCRYKTIAPPLYFTFVESDVSLMAHMHVQMPIASLPLQRVQCVVRVCPSSGCRSGYEVIPMSWYAVAQNDMQLHWFHHMHSTESTDHHATVYPDTRKHATPYTMIQLRIYTFRKGKSIQNDFMTTAYHAVVTTSYPLLLHEAQIKLLFRQRIWYSQ